jgi:hypothetical protein
VLPPRCCTENAYLRCLGGGNHLVENGKGKHKIWLSYRYTLFLRKQSLGKFEWIGDVETPYISIKAVAEDFRQPELTDC